MSQDIQGQLDAYLKSLDVTDEFTSEAIIEFMEFLESATHAEGSAVEAVLSGQLFNEQSMGDLVEAGMICYWTKDENTGDYTLYSDKERMLKFNLDSLLQLRMIRALTAVSKPSWSTT